MLLMVEKGITGGICHAIHRYTKSSNKYMKNYNKDIESSHLMYLDRNNLYGQGMSQKLPVNGFKWIKNISKFDEDLNLILVVIFHFQQKERKLKNLKIFFVI